MATAPVASVQLSVCPLRQQRLSPAIDAVRGFGARVGRRDDSVCVERRQLLLEPPPQPPTRFVRLVRLTRGATFRIEGAPL